MFCSSGGGRTLVVKHWLIIPYTQNPEQSEELGLTEEKHITPSRRGTLAGVGITASLPFLIYAGMFTTTFEHPFFNTERTTVVQSDNVQTITLLSAVPNPEAITLARGGGDILIVDDAALLAESGPSGTIADVEEAQSDRISVYVVREGDTLSQIADMFGVTANTIRWANDISSSGSIRPGQTLVILPINGVQYKVKKGDTLGSIAKDYSGDLEEIANYNAIAYDATLTVGETIIIPNGEVVPPTPTPTYSAPTVPSPSYTGPTYAGYYMRPISGGRKSQRIHGYNAVDLATYYGAEIFASAPGEVIISRNGGWNGGYGIYTVIRHDNGTQTLYAHNSQNIVSVGQRVVQGQVIGYVGSTGLSTGPHVHFEVRGFQNPF